MAGSHADLPERSRYFPVTVAVETWYDPDPSSTIIEEDTLFVESFFAIPNEEIESKLHLQSPWLLHLELAGENGRSQTNDGLRG
jgi:hypothetical protein